MALDAEIAEAESADLINLPKCYKDDVFNETKSLRMLNNFLDFEETQKDLVKNSGEVPSIDDLLKENFKSFEKTGERRNLNKDLENILNSEDEIFAFSNKEKEMDLETILASEKEVLCSTKEQLEYR